MPAISPRATRLALALSVGALAAGCGSFDNASQRIAGMVTPYKVEVVQGNFVSREQAEAVKPGMSRQQVRDILGTPLVTSIFHNERWDYVFTLRRAGSPAQERKLAVFFKGGVMERAEGDEMPSEAEFVATLGSKYKNAKVPPLQASEDKLQQFSAGRSAPVAPPSAPAEPAAATSYPPLEAPTR